MAANFAKKILNTSEHSMPPFYVSAPGKVILFGEHAAVYGKPALAAALSLRAYLLATDAEDDILRLDFLDIQLSHSWKLSSIPWEKAQAHIKRKDGKPVPTDDLDPEIVNLLTDCLGDIESTIHYTACLCFLYLYVHLCDPAVGSKRFCIRSTLPIGAGLGSSASTAVCLASSLAYLGGLVKSPRYSETDRVAGEDTDADFINSWSLMGEKCFHGNPSGIDNAVATHGGAVMYQRALSPDQPSVRTSMRNSPPFKLLLTNTKVPRSTAELVGGVATLNSQHPKTAGSILDAVSHLATEAYHIMSHPSLSDEDRNKLRQLVNINHGLLVALGVSHPALEKIKMIGDVNHIGATKLTGAGGGGCAITLLNDDISHEVLGKVEAQFASEGFETFEATLGGKGVGALLGTDDVDPELFSNEKFALFSTREDIKHTLENGAWKYW